MKNINNNTSSIEKEEISKCCGAEKKFVKGNNITWYICPKCGDEFIPSVESKIPINSSKDSCNYKDCVKKHLHFTSKDLTASWEEIKCKNCHLSKEEITNKVNGRAGCPIGQHSFNIIEPNNDWGKELNKILWDNLDEFEAKLPEVLKQFISKLLSQVQSEHNQDCTREEWARASERNKIKAEIATIKRWVMTIRDNQLAGIGRDEYVIREKDLLSIINKSNE